MRPIAVATKASDIPLITTEGPPSGFCARSLKAFIIPITVPNKPIKGALFPRVPRMISPLSMFCLSAMRYPSDLWLCMPREQTLNSNTASKASENVCCNPTAIRCPSF